MKKPLTTWKASQVPQVYRKILVVGVIHDTDLRFRSQIERHLAGELNRIGYEAASALAAYGAGGLAHMDEEATYITLYNRGYDALLTIALIDKHKEAAYKPEKIQSHSSLYFYNDHPVSVVWQKNGYIYFTASGFNTVPALVPSLFHNSWPVVPLSAMILLT